MKDVTMNAHLPNFVWDGGGHVLILYSKVVDNYNCHTSREMLFTTHIPFGYQCSSPQWACRDWDSFVCACVCVFFSFDLRVASLGLLRIRTKIPP